MATHDGHRDRMRERISKYGIDSLQSHELLEYLLYSGIPRKDTNEIAHELITTFGSLSAVFDADIEHLENVKGMTHNAAILLHSLPSIFSAYSTAKNTSKLKLDSPKKVMEYLQYKLSHLTKEEMWVICKNNRGMVINDTKVASGSLNTCDVPIRELVEIAIKNKAVSVILAHNHPSQSAVPSQSDIDATREVAIALLGAQIILDDHVIVSSQDVYSMRDKGLLNYLDDGSLKINLSGGKIRDIKF